MYRAIFFDVGGTLLQPWPSVGAVYAQVGHRHGIDGSAAEYEQAFRAAWKQLKPDGGLTSSSKAWWRRLVYTAVPQATEAYFEELYDAFTRADAWRVYDDVRETLAAARRRGVHVGVISNWDERLRPLLQAVGLTGWDSITVSCEVGREKPAREIFEAALRAAGISPEAACHVGDSYSEDAVGAAAAGMAAVLIDRAGNANGMNCRVVRDLREVVG